MSSYSIYFICFVSLLHLSAQECCDWPTLPEFDPHPTEHPFSVGINQSLTQMDSLQSGTHSVSQTSARQRYAMRPTEMTSQRVEANASYTITPQYQIGLSLPWVRNTMEMQHFMADHTICGEMGTAMKLYQRNGVKYNMDPIEGIGDLVIDGSMRLIDEGTPEAGQHRLYLRAGLKTPTGDYKAKSHSSSNNGGETIPYWSDARHVMKLRTEYAEPCMQPGTGSWDPRMQLQYHFQEGAFGASVIGDYELTTSNPQGYEYGDVASLGIFPSYRPFRMVQITTGLRHRHIEKSDDYDGNYTDKASLSNDPANTGGELTDTILSLTFFPLDTLILNIGVSFPLFSDLNGIQQSPGNLYTTGLSFRF